MSDDLRRVAADRVYAAAFELRQATTHASDAGLQVRVETYDHCRGGLSTTHVHAQVFELYDCPATPVPVEREEDPS